MLPNQALFVEAQARALTGCIEAETPFAKIYDASFGYVWKSVRNLGARDADVEDLVHETFMRAFQLQHTFDASRPIKPWLFAIAFRVVSEYRRRHQNRFEHLDEVAIATRATETHEDTQRTPSESRELVLLALESLPLDQRAIFALHELDGVSIATASDALGVPSNTLYSRLRFARAAFKKSVSRITAQRGPR